MARLGLVVVGISALAAWGCGGGQSRVYPPAIASDAAQKAMELYDSNKDGFLEGAELDKVPGLKAALKQVDTNGDGKINAEEISARIASWKTSKAARLNTACKVLRKGKPLSGATVTLVPESFLGTALKPATATTDQSGMAMFSVDGPGGLPGVPPGFYRVEVTKSGEDIPAKYNTETVLGMEVAVDNAARTTAIVYDLK
ncbi:MAG: hypothetical protein ABSG68_14610 [Thermoguttaceae bacterium]|jgi:hypothetical protein